MLLLIRDTQNTAVMKMNDRPSGWLGPLSKTTSGLSEHHAEPYVIHYARPANLAKWLN